MFLSAILLALAAGAMAGGGLPRLTQLRLQWLPLLLLALGARVIAHLLGRTDLALAGAVASFLFITGYVVLFGWLWRNRRIPGLQVAAVGIGANAVAVLVNGGHMPVWDRAYVAAGLAAGGLDGSAFHFLMSSQSVGDFVRQAGPLGDVLPIPLGIVRDVVSIGDVLLAAGIFWAIVYSMTHALPSVLPRRRVMPATPALGFQSAAASGSIAKATVAGGMAPDSLILESSVAAAPAMVFPTPAPAPAPVPTAPRVRETPAAPAARPRSPYLRLIRNTDFSLLWAGQLISLFGDRLHQIAIGVLVLAETQSAFSLALTFAAASAPNFLLGPVAGALVDRWNHKWTMVVSDFVRAGLVVVVPFAIEIDVRLVYVIAFVIATVTLVFRPAKNAAIPMVVDDEDLLTANSATSASETLADLVGYPVAGVLVASLGGLIGAAFFLDAATYIVSALFIWAMAIPAVAGAVTVRTTSIWSEMLDGMRFLLRQRELLANTAVSVVAQVAVGTEIALTLVYALSVLEHDVIGYPQNYAFMQAAIGLGSLLGGVAVGGFAVRYRKGRLATLGFVSFGLLMVAVGLVRDPLVAIALFFALGIANMLFIIPNMTLFQQRTPQKLMGRVVSTRAALVFGVMTASMAASGALAAVLGPGLVFILAGSVCALAGLAGLLFPAMRDAA